MMASASEGELSESDLFRLATRYLSRRSASKLQIRRYLLRKASFGRERSSPEGRPVELVEAVVARLDKIGLLDDASLAQSRAASLTRKGLPKRRVRRQLAHQGFDVSEPDLVQLTDLTDEDQAIRYAQRKRLGAFATGMRAPSFDRDVRALVRAGFDPQLAIHVLKRVPDDRASPDSTDEHAASMNTD